MVSLLNQARPNNRYAFSMKIGGQSDLSAEALAKVEALTKQEIITVSFAFVILYSFPKITSFKNSIFGNEYNRSTLVRPKNK